MKRIVFAVIGCALLAVTLTSDAADSVHWLGTWSAAPVEAGPPLNLQSVREIARISVGGEAVRLRLSNLFGTRAVTIGPVHIAIHTIGSGTRAGTDHAVTFAGQPSVTIPTGNSVLSDPVVMDVKPLQELAVSLYLPSDTGPSTQHTQGLQTSYLTNTGDATGVSDFRIDEVVSSRFFLTDIEVTAPTRAGVIITFGDSITDGYGSTQDSDRRWPDRLAERLQADPHHANLAVLNAGIGGNRILNDGAGPNALDRLERDALSKAGARWLILLEGINDIGGTGWPTSPKDAVTAEQIIAGMKTIIARAHGAGMKIFGATLTPFGGNEFPYHTARGETMRQMVNRWIRESGSFDAVIDFDVVTRDPAHPDRFLPLYDCGDHLHPNDAGYRAMADAIDLNLFNAHE